MRNKKNGGGIDHGIVPKLKGDAVSKKKEGVSRQTQKFVMFLPAFL